LNNNVNLFIKQIKTLYTLVMLQKSLRLLVRALWLGLAGFLIGWSLQSLFGWLPNPFTWLALGLAFAILPLAQIFIALYTVLADLSPPVNWVEWLDRRLQQDHQLSTAWELAQKGGKAGPVADLLVQDVTALFPRAQEPILQGGWYRKTDLVAATLMALFSCALLTALLFQPAPSQLGQVPTQAVPITAPQPPSEQAPAEVPQPAPGDQDGAAPEGSGEQGNDGQNQGEAAPGDTSGDTPGSSAVSQDQADVADALRQLGSELSRQAGTHELGQALQDLDMSRAADALEDLSSQIDEITPETRDNLSQALDDAANRLDGTNPADLSEHMQDAANALDNPRTSPEQPLEQLADDLRQLESQMQAFQGGGSGAGVQGESGSSGQAEPADRLLSENGEMEIPVEAPESSGLLSPARPDAEGEGTASGSLDASQPRLSPAGQSPLFPSSFLWKWRDVVSQYFQRGD
jgi:hypothetical protein